MYRFRLCFVVPGKGTFSGEKEFVEFKAGPWNQELRLSAGDKGGKLGQSSRFSLSGDTFLFPEDAEAAAGAARTAVLLYSVRNRIGVDLGAHAVRGFSFSDYGRQKYTELVGAPVLEDHLGVTVFQAHPAPSFLRVQATAVVSRSTEAFVEEIGSTYKRTKPVSPKADVAASLYGITHFETSSTARFLALFMCLEALFEPGPRSEAARQHVDRLLLATQQASIPDDDKDSLFGAIGWLKNQSIAQTGRLMAKQLLGGNSYDSLDPVSFFKKIYQIRNDIVHRGIFDPNVLHVLVGEVDRFVSDILRGQFIDP